MSIKDLKPVGIIAFDGATNNGLQLHPDQKHLIYPVGTKVTIKNIDTGRQIFLSGHSDVISAMCVSPCGKYIASGQVTHLGFKATVIVWDYEEKRMKSSHEIHKARIQDLCFTCESNYLLSLGGRDDGNVVIFDLTRNEAICGSFASNDTAGNALIIARTNIHDRCFMTGGNRTLMLWQINPETRKVYGVNVKVGKLQRTVNCIVIDARDEIAYCGTSSGDIIKARLNYPHGAEDTQLVQSPIMVGCYSKISKDPKKQKCGEGDLYSGGVTCLLLVNDDEIVVGAGDGTVELIDIADITINFSAKSVKLPSTPQIRTYNTENVRSSVTSMLLHNDLIFVGTVASEIYQIRLSDFDTRLVITCHTDAIYDIAFPHNFSEIFATGSKNDIRLWHLESQRELLRITVPNLVCTSLCFSFSGKMLVSAWNDGTVRSFKPRSGQMIFTIHNAHIKAVSAICITANGKRLITGGCDAQVRIWSLLPDVQSLICILKEHRGSVTSLHVSSNDTEVISSSTDGTCIVWDIVHGARKQVLMGNTMYMSARFSPNGVQIITCGADRKIAYWETLDGSLVRELEGSATGALNCLDTSPDGRHILTGSNDCIVKIWDYNSAETTHVGLEHAAIITACKFSPDSKHLVTVSADGAIIIWKSPFEPKFETPPESSRSRSTCSRREEEWNKLYLCEGDRASVDIGDDDVESVVNSEARYGPSESIRTVHQNGSETDLCNYDPLKTSHDACLCRKAAEKDPISENCSNSTGRTSSTSQRSNRSCSVIAKNQGSGTRQRNLRKCENSKVDTAKYRDRVPGKIHKSQTGDCNDSSESVEKFNTRGNGILLATASVPKTRKPVMQLAMCGRK